MKKNPYDFSDLKFKLNIENILNSGKNIQFNNRAMYVANDFLKDKIRKNVFLIGTAWIFLYKNNTKTVGCLKIITQFVLTDSLHSSQWPICKVV